MDVSFPVGLAGMVAEAERSRKDSVSKTSSGMPCKRSIISMPSSLLGETGAVAEDVVAEYVGDGVVENVKFST